MNLKRIEPVLLETRSSIHVQLLFSAIVLLVK